MLLYLTDVLHCVVRALFYAVHCALGPGSHFGTLGPGARLRVRTLETSPFKVDDVHVYCIRMESVFGVNICALLIYGVRFGARAGRKWHSLSRAEQERYYELSRTEKQKHLEDHPGTRARTRTHSTPRP